ncbi:hypothetical protein QJS10_CPB20g00646 [Acorus calamus]|uniref:Uncharacterized protein n=1 Tax=Acorus calamus TaxID=4465 RepID=A0AAV9CAJ7_ACOCL|nr:hypothetical protein QJS10_CPB20g00646 [Acorus calamus]
MENESESILTIFGFVVRWIEPLPRLRSCDRRKSCDDGGSRGGGRLSSNLLSEWGLHACSKGDGELIKASVSRSDSVSANSIPARQDGTAWVYAKVDTNGEPVYQHSPCIGVYQWRGDWFLSIGVRIETRGPVIPHPLHPSGRRTSASMRKGREGRLDQGAFNNTKRIKGFDHSVRGRYNYAKREYRKEHTWAAFHFELLRYAHGMRGWFVLFKYLGLPLVKGRMTKEGWDPLVVLRDRYGGRGIGTLDGRHVKHA